MLLTIGIGVKEGRGLLLKYIGLRVIKKHLNKISTKDASTLIFL